MAHKLTKEEMSKGGKNGKRGMSLVKLLDKYSDVKVDGEDRTYEEKIMMQLITNASDGNLGFIKEYYDRKYGKSLQAIEHSGDADAPVIIRSEIQKKFIEEDNDN